MERKYLLNNTIMKREYTTPHICCVVMDNNLLDYVISKGVADGKNREYFEVNTGNNESKDDGKSLGAKSDNFSDWDD